MNLEAVWWGAVYLHLPGPDACGMILPSLILLLVTLSRGGEYPESEANTTRPSVFTPYSSSLLSGPSVITCKSILIYSLLFLS